MSRERINVSLTEQGLEILDRERETMGLSRMFEVLLRFWVRDQPAVAQVGAAEGTSTPPKPRRRKQSRAAR